jgi:hypothetical protein
VGVPGQSSHRQWPWYLECSSFAISNWHSVGSWPKAVHSQHAWAAAGSDHIGTAMDRAPGRSIGPMGCVEPLVLPPPSWTLPVGPSGGRRLVHLAAWPLGLQWASPSERAMRVSKGAASRQQGTDSCGRATVTHRALANCPTPQSAPSSPRQWLPAT